MTVRRAFAEKSIDMLYPGLLTLIADTRNLRAAWDHLERFGGQTPGPNGWTYSGFLEHEIWNLLKVLQSVILERSYYPGPTRRVQISKGQGRGTRTLTLQDIQDRVVQRAILQVIAPLLDPGFDAYSFGGRPARGPLSALAAAVHLLRTQQRTIWITEDLKDAFDHVPLSRLMQVFQKGLPAAAVVEIVGRVVHNDMGKGLAQGAPLSPLLMNLYLDHFFDRPWRRRSSTPTIRFIDDLLVLCGPADEPAKAYQDLSGLMTGAGMHLKGSWPQPLHRLDRGDTVKWLGYQVRLKAGELHIDLDHNRWFADLGDDLLLAHAEPQPALKAVQIIEGKLSSAGPAYAHGDIQQFYDKLVSTSAEFGFEEIPTLNAVIQAWSKSHSRWLLELEGAKRTTSRPQPLPHSNLCAVEAPF